MSLTRTENVIYNTLYGMMSALLMIFLNFAVRYYLVKSLGDEYYGLHSFYQSITNLFTMLEMGISSAVIIHLYEPVKNNSYETIKQIMSFYRIIYRKIALIFSLVTLIFGFTLLPLIVHTGIDTFKVVGFYLLFSASFTVDFMTYHRRSILFADQKNRISSFCTMIAETLCRGTQIICLIVYPSYLLFLILFIVEKLFSNTLCNRYVKRHYPFLINYARLEINKSFKENIINTIKPLFVFQIATTVQGAIPSILISLLLGNISVVGYYANYQLVSSTMILLYSQIGGAFTTSFGNLAVEKNLISMEHAYLKTSFVTNSLAIVLFSGYICCIQDFIQLVFGEHFLLPIPSVIVIALLMYVSLYNVPMVSIQNAMGLHRLDVRFIIIQTVLSAIFGCVGCALWNMEGLFIGLLFPMVIFAVITKGVILSKYVFNWTFKRFVNNIGFDFVKLIIVGVICYHVACYINTSVIMVNFFLKGVISVVLSVAVICGLSYRNSLFREFLYRYK